VGLFVCLFHFVTSYEVNQVCAWMPEEEGSAAGDDQ